MAILQHPDGRVEAGPPLEIRVAGAGFFDHDTKYDGSAHFQIPAPLDAATTRLVQERAVQAFHALGCRGLLRVDFFLPGRGPRRTRLGRRPPRTGGQRGEHLSGDDGRVAVPARSGSRPASPSRPCWTS